MIAPTSSSSSSSSSASTSPSSSPSAAAAAVPAPWRWEDSEDAIVAYGVLFAVLALGAIPALQGSTKLVDLPYFVSLAITTIYIGAHRGLTTKQRQQISIKEGALAPVFASVSLFGLYIIIKYFPDFSLQTFLNAYFWLIGSIAITGSTAPVLRQLTGDFGQKSVTLDIPEGWLAEDDGVTSMTKVTFAPSDIVALTLGLALASAELASGHTNFTLNNLIACLVASDILQLVGLRSFRTAVLLLAGLLIYDVFWVFASPSVIGENVMMTVATSDIITGPTRLLFPRLAGGTGEAASFPFSLLGLGDIAVPGLLACLALRYDGSRSTDMRIRAAAAAEAFTSVFSQIQPGATGRQIADATADAADAAYDNVADLELKQRNNTINGVNENQENGTSSASDREDGSASVGGPPVSDAVLYQRVYFMPVLVAYVVGLTTAFAANSITGLGQPALLYIVPSTLSAVALVALSRSEFGRVWAYTDVPSFGAAVAAAAAFKKEMNDDNSKTSDDKSN
ncbi:MAG: hypothetical protein WDW36_002850 [Sanguina aurantia]